MVFRGIVFSTRFSVLSHILVSVTKKAPATNYLLTDN